MFGGKEIWRILLSAVRIALVSGTAEGRSSGVNSGRGCLRWVRGVWRVREVCLCTWVGGLVHSLAWRFLLNLLFSGNTGLVELAKGPAAVFFRLVRGSGLCLFWRGVRRRTFYRTIFVNYVFMLPPWSGT